MARTLCVLAGTLLLRLLHLPLASAQEQSVVTVSTVQELVDAVANASIGEIVVLPGHYVQPNRTVSTCSSFDVSYGTS